jgi:hypothetical protein
MPQLKQAVQRRMQRPPIPDDAPKSLRELLDSCWAPIPSNRPSFAEILKAMDGVIDECKEAECRQKIYEAAGGDIVASVCEEFLDMNHHAHFRVLSCLSLCVCVAFCWR